MTPRRARPLRLELVEDRCLPSAFRGGPEPHEDSGRHAEGWYVHRPSEQVAPNGERIETTAFPDESSDGPPVVVSRAGELAAISVGWVPAFWFYTGSGLEMVPATGPVTEIAPARTARQPEPRAVAEQAEPTAASQSARAAASQAISVAVPTGGTQTAVNVNASSTTAERPANVLPSAPDGARSAAADAPAAGVVFYGGVAVPSEAELPDVAPTPVAPVTVPTPPGLPSPREVVGRVIDAVLPVGAPLTGVVPFEAEAFDAAAELIAKLPSLAPDAASAEGWESPERWAWVTAGVLVAGGAAYAAAGANARRAAAPALGADSALARWEDRRGRKPA